MRLLNRFRSPRAAWCVLAFAFGAFSLSAAADDSTEGPKQFAVLIGIDRYEQAPPLSDSVRGILGLSQTLRHYAGYRSEDLLLLVDSAVDPALHPTREHLQKQLPAWLSKVGPDDRLLVAFSGHGYRDEEGKLYLAPQDVDPADLPATGVPVEWLAEQLADCPAAQKIVLLDTRQAPPEAAEEATGIAAAELAEPLEQVPGVVVLAASAEGQPSLLWPARRQSAWSYWLAEGLKGHADLDGDGRLTLDELSGYVARHVAATAAAFEQEQTPALVGLPEEDEPEVARVRPQSLKRLLADLAEQLAVQMELAGHERLGVLEFTAGALEGETLGGDFGLLGRYCAVELERQLVPKSVGRFGVADRRRLENALKELEFGVGQLGSPEALAELGRRAGDLPVVALGTLVEREERLLSVRCQLLPTDGGPLLAEAGGRARLNDSEWAKLGRSVYVEPIDYPTSSPDDPLAVPVEVTDIAQLEERAEGPHPLADPAFPFRVRIMVDRKEREATFRDNEMLVPLSRGEVYRIYIENRADHPVFMRLLVDGLNTLPERVIGGKDITVEEIPKPEWLPAQPVNLAEARAWRLRAPEPGKQHRLYMVQGFFSKVGGDAAGNEFLVVDARDSEAARMGFAEQAGLITAAFYQPISKTAGQRSLGSALGAEYQTQTDLYTGDTIPGPMLGVVHLRYVSPDSLE